MRGLAILVVCLGLGLAACGREETEQAGQAMEDAGQAADAAMEEADDAADAAMQQAGEAAEEAGEMASDAADAVGDAADAAAEKAAEAGEAAADAMTGGGSQDCLDLVAEGKFSEAVPVCTEALAADPMNQAVKDALEKAKAESGQ